MKLVCTLLLVLAAALGSFAAAPALAQGCGPSNPNCEVPNRPNGDSTNAAANTRFVLANGGGGSGITALTGDITATGPGSAAATLATVNSNTGSFGSSTTIVTLTVNAKGLITAVSTNAVIAPAGTLSGSTLAAGVTASSLTSFGNAPALVSPAISGAPTGIGASITINSTSCTLAESCTIAAGSLQPTVTMITGGTPNGLLYDNAGVLGNLATANSGVLVTSSGGVPSISTTLPSGLSADSFTVTTAFTATGLVTNGDLANAATTVNGQTCTLGSTCTVAAAAGTLTGTTLASGVVTSSLTTVGTIGTGAWQATPVALAYGGSNANLTASNGGIVYSGASALAILGGTGTAGQCLLSGSNAAPTWGSCTGTAAVSSLGNATSDTTLTLAGTGAGPYTGAITVALNLGNTNIWTGTQTFANGDLLLKGSSSGAMTLEAPAAASTYVMTFPAATDTVAVLGSAQTFTAAKTFSNSDIKLLGSSTGATTFTSANASGTNYTITVPAVTSTMAVLGLSQTFTATQTFSASILGADAGSWGVGGLSVTTVTDTGVTSAVCVSTNGSGLLGVGSCRQGLTGNTNYYVNGNSGGTATCGPAGASTCSAGSDSNNCLTISTACLTLQHVVNLITNTIDAAGNAVNVYLAHNVGTTNYDATCAGGPFLGAAIITVLGDSAAPTATVIKDPNLGYGVQVKDLCTFGLQYVEFIDSGSNNAAGHITVGSTGNAAHVDMGSITFAALASGNHISVGALGSIALTGGITISGGAGIALVAQGSGQFNAGTQTITVSGTPAFTYFAYEVDGAEILVTNTTFSGSATGQRCLISGIANFAGYDPNVILPGNSSCTSNVLAGPLAATLTQTSAAQNGTVCFATGTNLLTYDATLGCLTSLEELKDIHGPITGALAEVVAMRPFWFSPINRPKGSDLAEQPGFGAHQIEAVDPRLVGYGQDGKLRGVRYMEMTAVLAAAIKELKADNDNLRAEMEKLRAAR